MIFYKKPIAIELMGSVLFVGGNQHPKSVRLIKDVRKTLYNSKDADKVPNKEIYFMYRNVYKKHNLRYDITLIPALESLNEFPKTFGHYHPKSKEGIEYPEIYQVLSGKATFILQKKKSSGPTDVDVMIIKAEKGDCVLFPPAYGHVSINSGNTDLVLCNLVSDNFESIYSDYETYKGAAYYYLKDGSLVQNTNYFVTKCETLSALEFNKINKFECKDLLKEFYENPSKFEYLDKPSTLSK